jgi:hypothetical protein
MRRMGAVLGCVALLAGLACRAGRPLINTTPADQTTPGTIGGILKDTTGQPLASRTVHAVDVATSRKYSATTNVTGGFSIQVPPGKYRLQVDLLEGERVARDPGEIDINKSDLDANLEVVIGG